MIYLVVQGIYPNTAANNRALGFFKGFQELGIDHTIVVVSPNKDFSRIDESIYGKTLYLYKYKKSKSRLLNLAVYVLFTRIINFKYLIHKFFIKRSNQDSAIIFSSFRMLSPILKSNKNGYKIYYEISEHPNINKLFKDEFLYKKFIEDCLNVDGIFPISSKLKEYFVSIGVESNRIKVINMTVDSTRFDNVNRVDSESYIAYCGSISNFKDGVDVLIKSFAIVAKQNKRIKLYIIGRYADSNTENTTINLIKSLNIQDRIVFTGEVSASQMPQLLVNAKVLVLARPNNWQATYGFPTKLGEYLLSETPVVITKTGDIPLFLTDMVNALLCEPENCEEIAKKILWVLNHEDKAKVIGVSGRRVALEHFNYMIETKKIIEHIKDENNAK